ncbi:MAG: 23S rRNA (adenine(2503)-C(2))-methyltransferase RlmN [Candidatus Dojkabacteria bacterium]|nr:MAG: 23S rRNA (adenine(2503)-C(2))-methyltransferase RlmN [Candidatus Dojkabacteria bacterium]
MIDEFASTNKLPAFRLKQFNEQFYKSAVNSFDEITNWPAALRENLSKSEKFSVLKIDKELTSKDGNTVKVLFKREDGQRIETVLMQHQDGRNTVCVSSMVGCPVNCSFCATGKMGFGGNLTSREIIDQVMHFQRFLKKDAKTVTNVVYMGMGEPLLNLGNVMESINILTDPGKLGLGKRRLTVSTSGYIPQLKTLIQSGYLGRLAISLHAPNQELRAKLMPVAKIFPLPMLMEALDEFVSITNKRVSYEYVLIKNINDQHEHALQLIKLLKRRLAHVNLIPYNPIAEVDYLRSPNSNIARFKNLLSDAGIHTTVRVTMGDDVNAACGQLADRENKKNSARKIGI